MSTSSPNTQSAMETVPLPTWTGPFFGINNPVSNSDPLIIHLANACLNSNDIRDLAAIVGSELATPDQSTRWTKIVIHHSTVYKDALMRARRRIAKEPMLTEKGRETMLRAVVDVDVLQQFSALPFGTARRKRRNERICDILELAMKEQSEQSEVVM